MSTFEGSMMYKTVNTLSHYTDWTIGHVHSWCARLGYNDLHRRAVSHAKVYGRQQMHNSR
jgi:cbb3-type cytochrome oxidase subunit 1